MNIDLILTSVWGPLAKKYYFFRISLNKIKIGSLCSIGPRFKDISQNLLWREMREKLQKLSTKEWTDNGKVLIELGDRDRTAIK